MRRWDTKGVSSCAVEGRCLDRKVAFLDASSHLYKMVCPSVRPSVRLSIHPLRLYWYHADDASSCSPGLVVLNLAIPSCMTICTQYNITWSTFWQCMLLGYHGGNKLLMNSNEIISSCYTKVLLISYLQCKSQDTGAKFNRKTISIHFPSKCGTCVG